MDHYGVDIALWISFMSTCWYEYRRRNWIDFRGFFSINKQQIKSVTHLKYNKQTQIVQKLVEDKILEVEKRGIPARNHYRINFPKLSSVVFRKQKKIINNNGLHSQSIKNNFLYNNKINNISSSKILLNNKLFNNLLSEEMNFSGEKFNRSKESNFSNKKIKIKLRKKVLSSPQKISPEKNKSHLMKDRLKSFQDEVDLIFDYWGSLGSPLHKHRRSTKTYHQARKLIQKALSRYSADKIKKSMDNYHRLLTDEDCWVHARSGQSELGYVVSIVDFFKFTPHLIRMMKVKKVNVGFDSWFKECVGKEYEDLKNKYGDWVEINNPTVLRTFRNLYKKKKRISKISVDEENKLRKGVIRFEKFLKDYSSKMITIDRTRPETLVEYVFDAVGEDVKGQWRIVTAGWFCSEKTYEARVPLHLKKIGIILEEIEFEERAPLPRFNIYESDTWK